MNARAEKAGKKENRAAARSVVQKRNFGRGQMEFVDNRGLSPIVDVKQGLGFVDNRPVQRYFNTAAVPSGRMSDGDRFITVGKKSLFAKSSTIEKSNASLNKVGALVTLATDGRTVNAPQGEFQGVRIEPNAENMAKTTWERIKSVASESEWRTYADCYRNSATVSGMTTAANDNSILKMKTGDVKVISIADGRGMGSPGNVAGLARMTFYLHAIPRFVQVLRDADSESYSELITLITTYLEDKPPTYGKANSLYLKIGKNKEALALLNNTFGVNSEVVPEVGEAVTQVGDERLVNWLNDKGEDKWNFHWAGIIMVDGSDYVTLENCAVTMGEVSIEEYAAEKDWYDKAPYVLASDKQMDIVNERWYFKMYGADKQSFHSKNSEDSHATKSGLTLGLTHSQGIKGKH